MRRLLVFILLAVGLAAPAIAAPSPAVRAFYASDLCRRLKALELTIMDVRPVIGNEVLVAYYVPFQGALSDWDDETRLVLYRWTGGTHFQREQFVTKAGEAIGGRLAGIEVRDLDGDGQPEIVAVGSPGRHFAMVTSLIFRRDSASDPYVRIWKRHDLGAALRVTGTHLFYSYQIWDAARTRKYEHDTLLQGAYQRQGGN